MNKQNKGNGSRGIEWCDYTNNAVGGCFHDCQWAMPDGSIANCYAEDVADRLAQKAYPEGFRHHYWRPDLLQAPLGVKQPSRIFWSSMADLFGHWVPDEQIHAVLDACRAADWHTHILLTKNAPRLHHFSFPPNCWVGISAPPSFMMGKPLTFTQQDRWFYAAVRALCRCDARVKWISFEPLSYNITDGMSADGWEFFLDQIGWAVIGAASNGAIKYQPDPAWVENLIDCLDCASGCPIFFKGNLKGNPAANPWREEFPEVHP